MITLVAAIDQNGVIADSGKPGMLWYSKEELAFFKKNTLGKVCVFGRKTAELVGPLKGRDCIVLSRQPNYRLHGFMAMPLEVLLFMNEYDFDRDICVCGGGDVYRLLMPYANAALVSRMRLAVGGDIKFPDFGDSWAMAVGPTAHEEFEVAFWLNKLRRKYKHNIDGVGK